MKESLKSVARGLAFVAISPMLLWFVVKRAVLGPDRALQGSAQALALVPGLPGQYVRRAFLSVAIAHCAPTSVVEFGVTFSQAAARLDDNVYLGPFCSLGRVHLERDVLVAGGVHIPSGADTHATTLVDRAIREQGGTRELIRVGQGTWIGNGAIVMADIGRDCVIGAGAVVTTAIPDRSVAVGVPARVIRVRGES
jgi:virginiamycin A acetyltransferase